MAHSPEQIEQLVGVALKTLVDVMQDKTALERDRVAAAKDLLDRTVGKANERGVTRLAECQQEKVTHTRSVSPSGGLRAYVLGLQNQGNVVSLDGLKVTEQCEARTERQHKLAGFSNLLDSGDE